MNRPEPRYRYQEIADDLRAGIVRGEFRRTGRLPSERALGERFGVQRNTIRQALTVLEEEGHISTEGKRGSFLRSATAPVRDVILLTFPSGTSPHLNQLELGITRTVREAGLRVRRVGRHHAEGAVLDPVPDPASFPEDAAGMIMWPQNPTDEDALARLNAAVPLVLVDRRVMGVSADCVRFDDVTGGRIVTEHLIAQGHRHIGFLTDDVFAETVQHRWQGYISAHEAAGIKIVPALSLFLNGIHDPYFSLALRHLIARPEPPTAMVCSNDVVAFRLFQFLQSEGVRVPDDLAVTGYGNTMPDYVRAMGLTTIDQPFAEVGAAAARILLGRTGGVLGAGIDGVAAERSRRPMDVTVPVNLIVRKSSGTASAAPTSRA